MLFGSSHGRIPVYMYITSIELEQSWSPSVGKERVKLGTAIRTRDFSSWPAGSGFEFSIGSLVLIYF